MTRLYVFGQPYSAQRIARLLNSSVINTRAVFVEPRSYARLLAASSRSEEIVVMRVGYRVGASTARGRVFDAFWSLLRRAMPEAIRSHYWLGTDVQDTVREVRAGTLRSSELASAREDLHLSVAPWLTTELESVGIPAITALLPPPNPAPTVIPPLPSEFGVLTYLPSARFDFYGGRTILETAARMLNVRFDIVGGPGDSPRPTSSNVNWHGWVANMSERYAHATVIVRIPEHDGFGNTVIEGLLNARHVVYTHEVPFVRQVSPPTADALVRALEELRESHLYDRLRPNFDGRTYALDEFNEENLFLNLAGHLRARFANTR